MEDGILKGNLKILKKLFIGMDLRYILCDYTVIHLARSKTTTGELAL